MAIKKRVNEIIDFSQATSPYEIINKGWINDFIYLKWGKNKNVNIDEDNELIRISFHWTKELAGLFFSLGFLLTIVFLSITFFIANR